MNTKQMARAPLNRSTSRRALAAAFAACLSVGCGGGSGGNDAVALGTVVVTVVDALGAPVAGASVTVNSQTPHGRAAEFAGAQGFADARGVASVEVAPGNVWAEAYDESIGYFGDTPREPGIVLPPNGSVDITVTVHPSANPSLGIAPAAVSADAIADDGRSFEFTLKAIAIGAEDGWDLTLADCVPDTNNDSPIHTPDCVGGQSEFDAPYSAAQGGNALAVQRVTGGAPTEFSAAVLLDQSSTFVANDAWDSRLSDTKYFLQYKRPTDRVVLAAFASDDAASGDLSPLPQEPVTIFPLENPQFTTAGTTYFSTIDDLDSLEGGASPLYASIDRMLDFTATDAPVNGRRAVVVLTGGHDDTCGSAVECEDALQNLIEKSRANAIPIFPISLMSGTKERQNLSRLAEFTGGAALWADSPQQVGILFGALNGVLGGTAAVQEMRFRLDSPITGAFQSGRTVFGIAQFDHCFLWGSCSSMAIPFAVRIP
jgi:hypothetical protein